MHTHALQVRDPAWPSMAQQLEGGPEDEQGIFVAVAVAVAVGRVGVGWRDEEEGCCRCEGGRNETK